MAGVRQNPLRGIATDKYGARKGDDRGIVKLD